MMGGLQWMPMWPVDSLGILVLVCKENKFVLNVNDDGLCYLSLQIQLLILMHSSGETVLSS